MQISAKCDIAAHRFSRKVGSGQRSTSFSANGSSLLDRSGVANCGSIVSAVRYFLMVFRDSPVRRAISRIGKPCHNLSFRMTFRSLRCPPSHSAWGRVTWVKSKWKLYAYPGHFSVEINMRGVSSCASIRTSTNVQNINPTRRPSAKTYCSRSLCGPIVSAG